MTERDEDNRPPGAAGEDWPILRAQPRSFFKAPLCVDLEDLNADAAFIGMPFDQGTLGRPGARYGLRTPSGTRPGPIPTPTPLAASRRRRASSTLRPAMSFCGA